MIVDNKFENYFKDNLKQVFIYLTDKCQLHCAYCLYKTNLSNREIDYDTLVQLIKTFYSYGARKITLLGGEPTLYSHFIDLLGVIKEIGYEYLRVDTNGVFPNELLDNPNIKLIDNISFSLDDYLEETTSIMRGNIHTQIVSNIQSAISKGLFVTVTSCVHKLNIDRIESIISYFQEIGIKEVNFHPIFKVGIDRDNFTGGNHLTPDEWVKKYNEIRENIENNKYFTEIRLSPRFIPIEDNYSYCPAKMGERVLVHPNGEIRICALCIGSKFKIAFYDNAKITWDTNENNEIAPKRIASSKYYCLSQTKDFGNFQPACISYKPHQKEYVWEKEQFDSRFV